MSVCLLVTFVSSAKPAESIEMPFGGLTPVGPGKQVLDGGQGRTIPFATARGDKIAMQSKFCDHLLAIVPPLIQFPVWCKNLCQDHCGAWFEINFSSRHEGLITMCYVLYNLWALPPLKHDLGGRDWQVLIYLFTYLLTYLPNGRAGVKRATPIASYVRLWMKKEGGQVTG